MYRSQALLANVPSHLTWEKYCGFLDLSLPNFMQIQRQRLEETLPRLCKSGIGRTFLRGSTPESVEQFRSVAPLTTYEDYLPFFEPKMAIALPEPPIFWAKTSRVNMSQALIPYSETAFQHLIDGFIAAFLLSSASGRDDTKLRSGQRVLYNLPPSPYLSGKLAEGLAECLQLRSVVDFDEVGGLEFHDKVTLGFERALESGVDVVASMTSVLLKMGEAFEHRGKRRRSVKTLLRPRAAWRMLRGLVRSRLEGRAVLPKDLWPLKALVCWGTDTGVYRDQIRHYWGCDPYEFLAVTEGGILAMQSWTRRGMTFVPGTNFLEFILERDALDGATAVAGFQTLLLDELKPKERYEVVITSCVGMPFVRYRTGVLVDVLAARDRKAGIALPQVQACGRVHDIIDIAGFTRLDEHTVSAAMRDAGLSPFEWTARKEYEESAPVLRVYIEQSGRDGPGVEQRLHASLLKLDTYYEDLEQMLGVQPLRITTVEPGTFRAYTELRREQGADLDRQSVPRINASDREIEELMLRHYAVSAAEPSPVA